MFDIRMYALEWYLQTIQVLYFYFKLSNLESTFSFLTLQSFSSNKQLLYILSRPLLINYINFFHDTRIEYSKMASNIFFTYLSIRTNNIVVTNYTIFNLSSSLDYVTLSYLSVKYVAFNTKYIIAAYPHNIIFLWSGFKHNDCSLFNNVIISKNYLEVLFFSLTYDRTGGIYYASLAKYNIANYLIKSKIKYVWLLNHYLKY